MISFFKKYGNYILFLGLFLVAEYLRIISDIMIERSAENILYCAILIIWAVQLRRRILDTQMRKVLVGLANSLIFLFVIRTCKYVLFDKNTILWYMYYIPLTMMPLSVFLMSKKIAARSMSNRLDKLLIVGWVLLNGMILTNDIHRLVFRFSVPGDIDTYTYGIGYVLTVVWIAVLSLLAIYNLYRVCSLPQSRRKIWILIIPMLFCVTAMVLDIFNVLPKVNGNDLYLFQEIVLIMVIAIVEACIRIGIIPSNEGYEEIFANSPINAYITDKDNRVVYSAEELQAINDTVRLHVSKISGGTLYYTEDIQEIVKLNHMLEEAAEVISAEKEMIEAENQLLADEAMYKTKNKLYDDIAKIVRPQVLMIESCLEKGEQNPAELRSSLSKATVLNAYIKRRINLSLIAMEHEQIQLAELGFAIAESLTYLNYSKISTSILNDVKNGSVDADICIKAYDAFEALLEAYYDRMSACMVTIDEIKDKTILRMTVETTAGVSLLPSDFDVCDVFEDEDMIDVTISLQKGGDAS